MKNERKLLPYRYGFCQKSVLRSVGSGSRQCHFVSAGKRQAGIAFYDKDFNYITGIQRPIAFFEKSAKINIIVPPNAVYFRTTYFNSSEIAEKGGFSCTAFYQDIKLKNEKLDYRDIVDGVAVIVDQEGGVYGNPIGEVYSS